MEQQGEVRRRGPAHRPPLDHQLAGQGQGQGEGQGEGEEQEEQEEGEFRANVTSRVFTFATSFGSLAMLCLLAWSWSTHTTLGRVERVDPRLDAVVPLGAELEVLGSGFQWVEGPAWVEDASVAAGGFVLFSDVIGNTVYKFNPDTLTITPFLRPSGPASSDKLEPGTNGLLVEPRTKTLLACSHGDRAVLSLSADGSKTTVVSHFRDKRLNSPNDLAVRPGTNDLYFTDSSYGLVPRDRAFKNGEDSPEREQSFNGVYMVRDVHKHTARARASARPPPDLAQLVSDVLDRPNGIGFFPDGRRALLSNSNATNPYWMVFDVASDGALVDGREWASAVAWRDAGLVGSPDGLAIDSNGFAFLTGPGGVHVFSPDAVLLGSLLTGVKTGNCVIGADGFLYVAADTHFARIPVHSRPQRV